MSACDCGATIANVPKHYGWCETVKPEPTAEEFRDAVAEMLAAREVYYGGALSDDVVDLREPDNSEPPGRDGESARLAWRRAIAGKDRQFEFTHRNADARAAWRCDGCGLSRFAHDADILGRPESGDVRLCECGGEFHGKLLRGSDGTRETWGSCMAAHLRLDCPAHPR